MGGSVLLDPGSCVTGYCYQLQGTKDGCVESKQEDSQIVSRRIENDSWDQLLNHITCDCDRDCSFERERYDERGE